MIAIRPELPADIEAIARVNDAAFGGPIESGVVAALRRSGRATISLVAVAESGVVGHIVFSPVTVEATGPPIAALGLGPMAVLPGCQRRGIGSRLVRAGLDECARRDTEVVVVLGHPQYYPRFGFVPAGTLGLRSEYDVPDDTFMAMELIAGVLGGRTGLVRYGREFADAEAGEAPESP